MPKKTLIALATAWGPKHGGINSFNYDFVQALGIAFHDKVDVFCVVPKATERTRQAQLPAHRRDLLVAWYAMVEACFWDRGRLGSGIEKMEAVMRSFATMAPHQRRPLEPYHLVAAAYLMQHAPSPERAEAYGQAWRNFLDAHGNRMPGTVTETLDRLNCAPPAGR